MKKLLINIVLLLVLLSGTAQAAITITPGAWAAGTTSCAAGLPATPQAGDVHVMFIGAKPYSATIGTPTGWTLITNTNGTNGTTANGTDVGSVVAASYYRIWQSGDTASPSSTITTGNTALCVVHRFRPTAGSTINTPVGQKGVDTSSGTGYAATMGADIGITAADAVASYTFIAGNNSTFGSPTLSATGVTFGTVTENPATEGTTAGGLDCEASASTALPSAGPSSAAAIVGWTLSVAQTGMSNLVRIRETGAVPGTAVLSGTTTTVSQNSLSISAGASAFLSTTLATASPGSLTVGDGKVSETAALSGTGATSGHGSLSLSAGALAELSGSTATAGHGTLTLSAGSTATLSGSSMTASAGVLLASAAGTGQKVLQGGGLGDDNTPMGGMW